MQIRKRGGRSRDGFVAGRDFGRTRNKRRRASMRRASERALSPVAIPIRIRIEGASAVSAIRRRLHRGRGPEAGRLHPPFRSFHASFGSDHRGGRAGSLKLKHNRNTKNRQRP
jgi:hypothetical protein